MACLGNDLILDWRFSDLATGPLDIFLGQQFIPLRSYQQDRAIEIGKHRKDNNGFDIIGIGLESSLQCISLFLILKWDKQFVHLLTGGWLFPIPDGSDRKQRILSFFRGLSKIAQCLLNPFGPVRASNH